MRRGSPRYVPLRYQFILLTTVMLVLILACLAVILSLQQSRTIQRQIEQQGISIARSLAAASMANLLTYNTLALERSANQVAQSPNILYVIIHDKEGRVAGYRTRRASNSPERHRSSFSGSSSNPIRPRVSMWPCRCFRPVRTNAGE